MDRDEENFVIKFEGDEQIILCGQAISFGGSSRVYRGKLVKKGVVTMEKLAIKQILRDSYDSDFRERIVNEFHLLKKLNNPHIIEAKSCYFYEEFAYILFEFCEGGDLEKWCSSQKEKKKKNADKFLLEELIIFDKIARALEWMHRVNIVHRDIKPKNILFKYKNDLNSLKVIDFGMASNEKTGMQHTKCGTNLYLAPEMIENGICKCTVDIWSLGIILYDMLYDRHPFLELILLEIVKDQKKLIKKIRETELEIPKVTYFGSPVPEFLTKLLKDMLQKDLENREIISNVIKILSRGIIKHLSDEVKRICEAKSNIFIQAGSNNNKDLNKYFLILQNFFQSTLTLREIPIKILKYQGRIQRIGRDIVDNEVLNAYLFFTFAYRIFKNNSFESEFERLKFNLVLENPRSKIKEINNFFLLDEPQN